MRTALFIFVLTFIAGCGTQPQLSEIVNDMVVITNYEPTVDFRQLSTYYMTMDTVGLNSNTSTEDALINDYSKLITAQIKKNLDQTGHTRVEKDGAPDFAVNVLIINDLSISQTVLYPGGYYYPSYNYGYSPYSGAAVTTNFFQQALLVIEFVDLKTNSSGNAPSVWVANIGDLINSYDTSTKTRQAIDQAFDQSQYLNR